ncbi:MAG: methyltransferase domain-containing protein [Croceibacterium sp.]
MGQQARFLGNFLMTDREALRSTPQPRPRFRLDRSLLVRLFGPRAALVHGDMMMLDRWGFVKSVMPRTGNGEAAFDVGCGTGAFSLNLAERGYDVVGLSWDRRNQAVAEERAAICGLSGNVSFPIGDARELDRHEQYKNRFEYVVSLENIEHLIDDRKLMRDLAACLKPGGWLVLSTPNQTYHAVTPSDNGPFSKFEDGWHLRRGYSEQMLRELAELSGLRVEVIGYCSGWFAQKLTWIVRQWGKAGYAVTFPLRVLPLLFDPLISRIFRYRAFSITMLAYKPRFDAS